MAKEALISKVFVKRPIWDKKLKEHSNRNIVDACWREISNELNVPDAELRKKWKYLRDQFSVEYGKIQQPRSGDPGGGSQQPTWPYFKSLLFLRDIVKPRPSSSNLKVKPKTTGNPNIMGEGLEINEGTANNSEVQSVSNETDNEMSVPDAFVENNNEQDQNLHDSDELDQTSREILKKRKRPQANAKFNETLIDLERKKTKILEEVMSKREADCEDLMFFKSLLPYVKKIPMRDKLVFRNKIQEVVNQFAFPNTETYLSNESLSNNSFTYISNQTSTVSPAGSSINDTYFPDYGNVAANDARRY